ncbi:MAG: SpoIID/LytB domain-containing protein, partial [Patescibacteria group bacterium]
LAHIYSGIFGYPLTDEEAKLWRIKTAKVTDTKLEFAKKITEKLKSISFILAVFITGSVAANNAKDGADIDLMIITKPNTLWLTRLLVAIYLKKQKLYKQIICPNIFLDTNHLEIQEKNLYTAHEVLQAKCLFDRSNIEQLWLAKNKWTKEYLPNAYHNSVIASVAKQSSQKIATSLSAPRNDSVWLLNLFMFVFQYLYQKPKQTQERVGLGYAFFHPNQMAGKIVSRYNELVKKLLIIIIALFMTTVPVYAEECSTKCPDGDLDKCIAECNKLLDISKSATKPHEQRADELQNLISSTENNIKTMTDLILRRKTQITDQEKKLAGQQEKFENKVRDYYVKNYAGPAVNFLPFFVANGDPADNLRNAIYKQNFINRDKQEITEMVLQIVDLNASRKKLEENQINLQAQKNNLEITLAPIKKLVDESKKYQSQLAQTSAGLSSRQQEIINSRSGSFTVDIGDIELADDYNASIKGFKESAPGGYFAVFSFGAFTHRKGMSQYGARGRAQSGQNYKTILKAYYGKEPVNKDTGGDIKVNGFSPMNFEEKYLMGIAEMPSSWHPDALKAQAVAARTYAYRYKTQGLSICTSEACQVFSDSKSKNPPDAWKQAVQSTRGEILEDVVTYYASTHGGYASPIGWDTTNGSGGSNFIDNAYDKIGGSPWLYKAWYTKEYSVNSDKCGRSNPWLSPEEMADIVNAAIALKTGGIDTSRITPVTTSCWGGNPYSMNELKDLVAGRGGISSANSVSVSQGNGSTNNVTINGVNLSGAEFKKAFNLRAPGRLSIPQSGFAFFNIEKK